MTRCIILILAAVLADRSCRAQDFPAWCPNITSAITPCINEFQNDLKDISNQFTNPFKVLDASSLASKATDIICHESTLPVVEKFYRCLYGKLFSCIPREWSKVFSNADGAIASLEHVCKNINEIDKVCVTSSDKVTELVTCASKDAPRVTNSQLSTPDGYLTYACSLFPKTIACYRTVYGSCSGKTGEILARAAEYQKPVGCGASGIKPSLFFLLIFLLFEIYSVF